MSKSSRKTAANNWGQDDFSLCDGNEPPLTRHARRRCKERHINPLRVAEAHAIVCNSVVVTAWQKEPDNFGIRSVKGVEYLRKTHTAVRVPKDVLACMPKYAAKLNRGKGNEHRSKAQSLFSTKTRSKKRMAGKSSAKRKNARNRKEIKNM